MDRKKCKDCKKNRKIKFFGVQKKYVSIKGKGISLLLYPYCKDCQYKRNRKSLTRSKATILRNKKYQKKYHHEWVKKNRTGTDWWRKYKK